MKRFALALLALAFAATGALAQSNPNLIFGQVPTAAQWNSYFAAKQDYLGTPACTTAGCTFAGAVTFQGHISGFGGAAPAASACAGFALTSGSSDTAGRVTFTSATSCAITFGSAYTNAPFCTVTPGSAVSTVEVTTTNAVLTATFGTAQTAMFWHCMGT